ncbi:MAG: PTS sugar transporter subunit IIC [Clostridia bacterium]|nr:PTS sugar transporter subunit IIC [Clostridia bacterium]
MAKSSNKSIFAKIAKRYFIDALSAMALGLFSSLIIGTIIALMAKIPGLSALNGYADFAKSVTGAAIGAAVAYGLKTKPLVIFSSIAVGAFTYSAGGGGPFNAYIGAIIGAEIGNLIAGRTKLDIILVPIFTILPGCFVGALTGPYIGTAMKAIGEFIDYTTRIAPIPMGMIISVVMGMILTAPISSAAIAVSIGISGIAGGAACVGCAANMVGFAVASFRDNGFSGLISQGLGTSMLQVGNIVRRPQIWVPAIFASAVLGPISTVVFKMQTEPGGAGMGTSGLVGQFSTYSAMTAAGHSPAYTIIAIVLMHIVFPAILAFAASEVMRKLGWIKKGDMLLKSEI